MNHKFFFPFILLSFLSFDLGSSVYKAKALKKEALALKNKIEKCAQNIKSLEKSYEFFQESYPTSHRYISLLESIKNIEKTGKIYGVQNIKWEWRGVKKIFKFSSYELTCHFQTFLDLDVFQFFQELPKYLPGLIVPLLFTLEKNDKASSLQTLEGKYKFQWIVYE